MPIVLDVHRAVRFAEQDRIVDDEVRVARVGVGGPLEVPESAAVRRIVAAVARRGAEVLSNVIGRKQHHAARFAVDERGRHRGSEIPLRRHVAHRVVNEHGIESPLEPHGSHVALDVLAVRVEPPAHGEHSGRRLDAVSS